MKYFKIISSFTPIKINYIIYNGGMLDIRMGITRENFYDGYSNTNMTIARHWFGKYVPVATNRRGIVHCWATFGKHVPAATNRRRNRRTVGSSDLSSVRLEL
jgi:hypothetical protein